MKMRHPSMTAKAAELMMATGKHYTADLIASETGITDSQASSVLSNIRNSVRYEIETTAIRNQKTTTRVVSISKRTVSLEVAEVKKRDLWRLALGFASRE